MPLGRHRPRPDSGSSPDSRKRELYEALLRSLAQGGEPLATREEFAEYVEAWRRAHPGRSFPVLDDAMPRAIARYRALQFARIFDWVTWQRAMQVAHGMQQADRREEGLPDEPFDAAQARAAWEAWRDHLVLRYRLGGLVTEEG